MTTTKTKIKMLCPGCGQRMRDVPAQNSTSRFVRGLYICHKCGVREAFEGNFMRLNLRTAQKWERIQAKWIYPTAFALLLFASMFTATPSHAELHSTCRWNYDNGSTTLRCLEMEYETPSAETQIIKVPPRQGEDVFIAWCKPLVTVDELGVEHVQYQNPDERCAQ